MPHRLIQFFNAIDCVFEWKLVFSISGAMVLVDLLVISNPVVYFIFTVFTAIISKVAMWMVERYLPNSKLASFIDRCTGYRKNKKEKK